MIQWRNSFMTLVLILLCNFQNTHCTYSFLPEKKAVVIVPVADMVGEPLTQFYPDESIETIYQQIPISWAGAKNDIYTCPRIHQLLFNEVVTIIKEEGKEVLVAVSNMFHEKNGKRYNQFWTLKQNLMPYNEIKKHLPKPIDWQKNNIEKMSRDIITLKIPFYDSITDRTYSAGTRFVMIGSKRDLNIALIFDPIKKIVKSIPIPSALCTNSYNHNKHEKIINFVKLLRTWAALDGGFIPLVWGGISFTHTYHDERFDIKTTKDTHGNTTVYWQRHEPHNPPYCGFDASGIILRATQICGIPYYCKSTTTA